MVSGLFTNSQADGFSLLIEATANLSAPFNMKGRSGVRRSLPTRSGLVMRRKEEIEPYVEGLAAPIAEEHGFELVDVEYVKEGGNWYVRVYVDKEGGITVDDCETVSRQLDIPLDRDDCIEGSYILEVSSPGLGRALKKDKDLARSIGQDVEVKLFSALDGQKEYSGILHAWDKEKVTLELPEEKLLDIKRSLIAQIRLAIDF